MSRSHRYKDLQLAQLRSFCLAATDGNFTTAAKALGLSVTTVWQHVRALERRLGGTLLRLRGRALEVTPEGRVLLEIVQPHVNGLDSLDRLFEAMRTDLPKQLTVASTYYLMSYHLPRCLQEFTGQHPSVRLNLRAGIWPAVVQMIEGKEADLGVVSLADDGARSPQLEYEHLFDLQLTLLTSAKHPLAHKKRLTPHDLAEYPLISSGKNTFSYRTMERLLKQHDLMGKVHIVMESPNTDIMRKYAVLGLGVGLTYLGHEAEQAAPGLVLRVFDPKLEVLPVVMTVRKAAHLPAQVQDFRKTVRRLLGR